MVTSVVERLGIDAGQLAALCEKWGVARLQLFGSFARNEARPDSDIDLMVTFLESAKVSLWDFIAMKEELETFFGRVVDLLDDRPIENPYRRASINRDLILLYEAV
jgi:predicted nucleotidyltransferase